MPSRLETREELNSDLIPIEFDFQSYLFLEAVVADRIGMAA